MPSLPFVVLVLLMESFVTPRPKADNVLSAELTTASAIVAPNLSHRLPFSHAVRRSTDPVFPTTGTRHIHALAGRGKRNGLRCLLQGESSDHRVSSAVGPGWIRHLDTPRCRAGISDRCIQIPISFCGIRYAIGFACSRSPARLSSLGRGHAFLSWCSASCRTRDRNRTARRTSGTGGRRRP